MIRLARRLVAVLAAVAWVVGTLVPPTLVGASAGPAAAETTAATAHAGMPCHDEAPVPNSGKTKSPCPVVAVCAKCFQVLPTVTAPVVQRFIRMAALVGFADRHAEGVSPAPPLEPPRA